MCIPNTTALPLYHFTRTRTDDESTDAAGRIRNPTSNQLKNLYRPTLYPDLSECTKQQFFGEYLHAYEDTFSHRDENNVPYLSTSILGHVGDNHDPDQTYNIREFQGNEDRTMRMAEEVFGLLQTFSSERSSVSWESIKSTVLTFSHTGAEFTRNESRWRDRCIRPFCNPADTAARKEQEIEDKADVLEHALVNLNLIETGDLSPDGGKYSYNKSIAAGKRSSNLRNLLHEPGDGSEDRFTGILLPSD